MKKVLMSSLKSLCLVSAFASFGLAGCQSAAVGEFCGEINGVTFHRMDANKDGFVSQSEFTPKGSTSSESDNFSPIASVGCQQRHADFSQVDGNGDGFITELEFDTFKNKVVVG